MNDQQYTPQPQPQIQPVVAQTYQAPILPDTTDFLQPQNQARFINDEVLELPNGQRLYFNKHHRLRRKQAKQLRKYLYKGAGMKMEGRNVSFDNPEVFITNSEEMEEVLVALYWNTKEFWETNGGQGNFWTKRPTDLLNGQMEESDADKLDDYLFNEMYKKVEDIDPLKSKKAKAVAEGSRNSST